MTNLTKLSASLNLNVLNSYETSCLKGGGSFGDPPPPRPPIKPIGGGGIPPALDNSTLGSF